MAHLIKDLSIKSKLKKTKSLSIKDNVKKYKTQRLKKVPVVESPGVKLSSGCKINGHRITHTQSLKV